MPRILGAIAAAIALHASVLILRPGVSGGHIFASMAPSSVLAVRIVPAAMSTKSTPSADPSTETARVSPSPTSTERSPDPSERPKVTAGATVAADRADVKSEPRTLSQPSTRAEPSTPASTALAAAPAYALGIQLDPGPRPLDEIEPEYTDPVNLRSGTVVLRLLISDTGHVDEVGVVRADPPGVFEQAAIEAFSKARFAPGMAGGRAVKSQIRIEVEFMPINRGARTSGRSY